MTEQPTSTDTVATEDDTTNLVPAHVIETKRAERDERTKLASPIAAQPVSGQDQQEAAAP